MRDQAELDRLFDALDTVFTSGQLRADGWKICFRKHRRTKQTVIYGRCYLEEKRIEINRVLARAEVPMHVLMATVWHEAAHAILGTPDHCAGFYSIEARYPNFASAQVWETENFRWTLANQ